MLNRSIQAIDGILTDPYLSRSWNDYIEGW